LECEYEVSEGTSQKNRFKQKFDALEFKLNDLETLIAELTNSNEELALHLLVRLRAGEPIRDIVQSVSDTDFSRDTSMISDAQSQQQSLSFAPMHQDLLFNNLEPAQFFGGPLIDPTLLNASGSSESHLETDESNEVISLISQASSTCADEILGLCLLSSSGAARTWMTPLSDECLRTSRSGSPPDWNTGVLTFGETITLACAG
jgi:hypothetical protein